MEHGVSVICLATFSGWQRFHKVEPLATDCIFNLATQHNKKISFSTTAEMWLLLQNSFVYDGNSKRELKVFRE